MGKYDVAIVGLGAMGTAALAALARRGARVIGIERFVPGHDRGSSHGKTRIIRLGYMEHPSYVPLLRRTYELWRELEAASGRKLLHVTGIAEIGPPDGSLVSSTLLASRTHGLVHEVMEAGALVKRFPAFRLPRGYVAVLQPDGGFVEAEPAIAAQVTAAKAAGAELRFDAKVDAIEHGVAGVRLAIGDERIDADQVIVSAGAWVKTLLPDLTVPLRVTRQVLAWFQPAEPALFTPSRFPVFLLENRHGVHYGFPSHGDTTVKIAKHHHADEAVEPESYDRTVNAADEAMIRAAIADHLPAANGALAAAKTCLYTVTPDGDFILDRMPGAPNVLVASPCSGHGFKFAPVIGEILADLALSGATRHDISSFRLARFG